MEFEIEPALSKAEALDLLLLLTSMETILTTHDAPLSNSLLEQTEMCKNVLSYFLLEQ